MSRKASRKALMGTMVAGAIAFVVVGVMVVRNLPRRRDYPPPLRLVCQRNLWQVGLAATMYAHDHAGHFPDAPGDLLLNEDITSEVFVCPATTDTPAKGPTTAAVATNLAAGGHLSYIYVGKGLTDAAPSGTILIYEPLTNHGGEGMNVVYADGHVEWVDAVAAGKIISELKSGNNPPRTARTQPESMP